MPSELPSEEQARTYLRSLEEIRLRLADIRRLAARVNLHNNEPYDHDLIAVHFRKVTELIAFGCLTANKKRYAEAFADFERHWKLRDILNNLARINPEFYPHPVILASTKTTAGRRHHSFTFVNRGYMNRSDLAKLYGHASQAIHTRNPFDKITNRDLVASSQHWIGRIERLLGFHQIRFADTPGLWIIEYSAPTDGRAHVYSALPEDPPGS